MFLVIFTVLFTYFCQASFHADICGAKIWRSVKILNGKKCKTNAHSEKYFDIWPSFCVALKMLICYALLVLEVDTQIFILDSTRWWLEGLAWFIFFVSDFIDKESFFPYLNRSEVPTNCHLAAVLRHAPRNSCTALIHLRLIKKRLDYMYRCY